MNLIPLNRHYLKAMLIAAAEDDIRDYLCAVYFTGKDGRVLAYSADGYQILRWIVCDDYQGSDFGYVIKRDAIKSAIKTKLNVFLNTENGDLGCNKGNENRAFHGVLEATYPNVERTIESYLAQMELPKAPHSLFRSNYLIALGKISKAISKNYTGGNLPACLYSSRAVDGYASIFTFAGIPDLFYILANPRPGRDMTHEQYAVTMDAEARDRSIVMQRIDNREAPKCGVSRHSHKTAVRYTKHKKRVFTIVAYDDTHFMDANGEIWDYVCDLDSVEQKKA